MQKLKILFTSVGRRVELMEAFRAAAKQLAIDLEIWGADITETAPALFFCDKKVQVCRIRDERYIPQLIALCKQEKMTAVVPTIDTDLLLLSQNVEKFEEIGVKVIISAEDKIQICRDKRLTAKYFQSLGLNSPMAIDNYRLYNGGFPAFIKPKDGSSSIFAYRVNDQEELLSFTKQVPDYIIQPFIEGNEYTIDIFCDFVGNPIYITPRERLAVRAGEVLKTKICADETMIEEIRRLLEDFKPCGAITVQLIKQKESNKNFYIEINPRFGGGAPLSMKAGANSAEALLKLLCGEKIEYYHNAAEDGAIYCRFDQSIRVDKW